MNHLFRSLLLASLLLPLQHAQADDLKFSLTGWAGNASISNFTAYADSRYFKLSGSVEVNPMLSLDLFRTRYKGFASGGVNPTEVRLDGNGFGVTGTWPLHPHLLPYLRLEYMKWNLSSHAFGRVLATESGGSTGVAVGVRIPVNESSEFSIETSGYSKISDANIRQYALGLTFIF